jgi:hypothetical protein
LFNPLRIVDVSTGFLPSDETIVTCAQAEYMANLPDEFGGYPDCADFQEKFEAGCCYAPDWEPDESLTPAPITPTAPTTPGSTTPAPSMLASSTSEPSTPAPSSPTLMPIAVNRVVGPETTSTTSGGHVAHFASSLLSVIVTVFVSFANPF